MFRKLPLSISSFKKHRIKFFTLALCLLALSAGLVQTGHGEPARRFHDIGTVRIVAGNAIHFAFGHRMMLRQMEFGIDIQVALIARLRIAAGIEDEFLPTLPTDGDMLARRTVTRFTAVLAFHLPSIKTQSGMGAGRKNTRNVAVAIGANLVSDEACALNSGRHNDGSLYSGTGDHQQSQSDESHTQCRTCYEPPPFYP